MICSCPWENVRDSKLFRRGIGATVVSEGERSVGSGGCGAAATARAPLARFAVRVPRIAWSFTGTGDLTAALLLAESARRPRDFVAVVEGVAASLHAVCLRTRERYAQCEAAVRGGDADAAAALGTDEVEALREEAAAAERAAPGEVAAVVPSWNELRIVASREDLERAPVERFGMRAELLDEVLT
jgi:hypothetical protein